MKPQASEAQVKSSRFAGVGYPVKPGDDQWSVNRVHQVDRLTINRTTDLVFVTFADKPVFGMTPTTARKYAMLLLAEAERIEALSA
jgi:hypothetical protein